MTASPFDMQPPPSIMGILNVTPNSFSDGGKFFEPLAAVTQAQRLAAQGARYLDLGAEASSFFRPGVVEVRAEEQLARLLPVLDELHNLPGSIVISVDTRSASVAHAVLSARSLAGSDKKPSAIRATPVRIINDISAGTHEPELLEVVAAAGAGLILMHTSASYPATPTHDDADIVKTVSDTLAERLDAACRAGVPRERIALDPGIGFGKTMADNWRLAIGCGHLHAIGAPLVIGASRKRFLETPPPANLVPQWPDVVSHVTRAAAGVADLHPRDIASAALTHVIHARTPAIHRVHHVTLARIALTMG